MLLIIVGAGASFDSIPSLDPKSHKSERRLPLAKDLFRNSAHFQNEIKKWPQMRPIVPYLRAPRTGSIEEEFDRIAAESDWDRKVSNQLTAVRYYLRSVISRCETMWMAEGRDGVTNYLTLFDLVRKHYPVDYSIVTFNYDTMIETSLGEMGRKFVRIEDYMSGRSGSLFKLHGSTNWGRKVSSIQSNSAPAEDFFKMEEIEQDRWIIDNSLGVKLTDNYVVHGTAGKGDILFPAIAIPLKMKRTFECPANHVGELKAHLSNVTKVVIIGWRASEGHFVDLLFEHLKFVDMLMVCGSQEATEEVKGVFNKFSDTVVFSDYVGGFTDAILSGEISKFLSTKSTT